MSRGGEEFLESRSIVIVSTVRVYIVAWRRPTVDSVRMNRRAVFFRLGTSGCLGATFSGAAGTGCAGSVTSIFIAVAPTGPPAFALSGTGLTSSCALSDPGPNDKKLSRFPLAGAADVASPIAFRLSDRMLRMLPQRERGSLRDRCRRASWLSGCSDRRPMTIPSSSSASSRIGAHSEPVLAILAAELCSTGGSESTDSREDELERVRVRDRLGVVCGGLARPLGETERMLVEDGSRDRRREALAGTGITTPLPSPRREKRGVSA